MNFEKKYKNLSQAFGQQFTPNNITSIKMWHYLCDFLELYAFFYQDHLSKNAIIDLFDSYGINLATLSDDYSVSSGSAIMDDMKLEIAQELLSCLKFRRKQMSTHYPFFVDHTSICIHDDLSKENELYLFLLFASNLNFFPQFKGALTTEFEAVTYLMIKNFLPHNAIVKQFGKKSDYNGNARKKIIDLAKDLNIDIRKKQIKKINKGNTQERGLDVIAWVPFNDGVTNMLTFLIQCACGKDWIKKFSETKRYLAYFDFYYLQPQSVITTPYALNFSDGFEQDDDVISSQSLFFDRARMLQNIKDCTDVNPTNYYSIQLVQKLFQDDVKLN